MLYLQLIAHMGAWSSILQRKPDSYASQVSYAVLPEVEGTNVDIERGFYDLVDIYL